MCTGLSGMRFAAIGHRACRCAKCGAASFPERGGGQTATMGPQAHAHSHGYALAHTCKVLQFNAGCLRLSGCLVVLLQLD
jgi:hypothetical protein